LKRSAPCRSGSISTRTFLADEVVKYRDIITKAGIARIE